MHADSIFVGAAEKSFPVFFSGYMNKKPQKIYNGIEDASHLSMPIPRRDLISNRYIKIPTVIANRGCSNGCGYCVINKLWEHEGTARPVNEVINEIKGLKAKRIIFLDPQFNIEY